MSRAGLTPTQEQRKRQIKNGWPAWERQQRMVGVTSHRQAVPVSHIHYARKEQYSASIKDHLETMKAARSGDDV